MLTIIHGDDIAASRLYYLQLKEKNPEATTLDGQTVNATDLAQILEGGGLFTEDKTLFLENFILKKKTAAEYKEITAYLNEQAKSANIILWEGKELEKSTLTPYKQSTVRPFKLPQSLFAFLDSLRPGNGQQLLQLFHQTLTTVEVEAIFPMLIRQLRLLLAVHDTPAEIEEVKRMQDWQRSKLKSQSKLFTPKQLVYIFCQLFVMETGQKTGTLPTDLTTAIDILLLEI
jgi:DNA polymerase III delta subunit